MELTVKTLRTLADTAKNRTQEQAFIDASCILERASKAADKGDTVAFHKELDKYRGLHYISDLFVLTAGGLAELYWRLYHKEMSSPRENRFMQYQWMATFCVMLQHAKDTNDPCFEDAVEYVAGNGGKYDDAYGLMRLAWVVYQNIQPHSDLGSAYREYLLNACKTKNGYYKLARVLTERQYDVPEERTTENDALRYIQEMI